ncbi:conjugal transfer protein TraF [Nitrospiraceae bacterium AH_259_D15_M11_P09]|nr:conjugal transfer protein TraF [Nitrospiraceae bacterium AH_259_D15_M11_P09]
MKTASDVFRIAMLGWCLAASMLSPVTVMAVEFALVGPRAIGMGGAGVAVTTDALATYWNPAGLAMKQSVDFLIQGSVQGVDRFGFKDIIDDIDAIDTNIVANQTSLQALLDKLSTPGTSFSGIGAGGVYLKGYLGNHAFGVNISDVATGGMFAPRPMTALISGTSLVVDTPLDVQALEARQAGFSYARALAQRTVFVGATVKVIQGAAYFNEVQVIGADGTIKFIDDLKKAEISTKVGVDVGAIYRPSSRIIIGVVGKDLNEPTFDAPGGREFKLNPQVRGGIAFKPYSTLTLTFDGDVTSNKTLVPGVKSRVLSLGAEQTLLSEVFSLRIGALKNVEDAKSIVTPTAGLGIRIFALRFDVGGGYDFRESGALVGFSMAMAF